MLQKSFLPSVILYFITAGAVIGLMIKYTHTIMGKYISEKKRVPMLLVM